LNSLADFKPHEKTPLFCHSGVLEFQILNWLCQRGELDNVDKSQPYFFDFALSTNSHVTLSCTVSKVSRCAHAESLAEMNIALLLGKRAK